MPMQEVMETPPGHGARAEIALKWICVAAAVVAIVPGLRLLGIIWRESEYLGHGYVIPLVSLWLIASKRRQIASALSTQRVPALGPLAVLLAAALLAAAVLGEVVTVAGASIPILLAAVAYAVGGHKLLRATWMPIAFLLLMVPLPNLFQTRLLIELKLLVTRVAVELLIAAGYTVSYLGNRVLLPGHELFVADACSGFTSVVTMLPLSIVIAAFLSHGIWRRAIAVASVLPLAFIGNVVRVGLTVVLVQEGFVQFRQGIFHDNLGMATFVIGTVSLIGIAKLLR
jgi:exosortase